MTHEEAKEAGIREERERVCAHLEMAERTGGTKIAIKAIREGSPMTQTLMAEYMCSAMPSMRKSRSLMDQGLDLLAQRRGKPSLRVVPGGAGSAQGNNGGDGGLVA